MESNLAKLWLALVAIVVPCCVHAASLHPDEVMQRLRALENKQREHEAEIAHLRDVSALQSATIQSQADAIRRLTSDNDGQTRTIQEFTERLKTAKNNIIRLQQLNTKDGKEGVDRKTSRATENLTSKPEDDIDNNGDVTAWKRQVSVIKRQEPTRQAFTVVDDKVLQPAYVVQFNDVITNEGGGYNTHTGRFTCSRSGVYLFLFSISEVGADHYAYVHLLVNGENKVEAVAHTLARYHSAQGSNSAVLRLNKGDAVWVGDYTHRDANLTLGATRLTSFSGVFLYG